MTDKNKLRAKMLEKGYTQEILAKKLNISIQSLNYKINNKRPFMADEMFSICDLLKIENPKEYFFANNVEK